MAYDLREIKLRRLRPLILRSKVNGQLIEIKGPQFLKEDHLYNPFTGSFDKEKEQCMLDNDVIIISDISEMKKLVFSKLGNDFVKEHILRNKYE